MDDNSTLTALLQKTARDFDPSRAHVDLERARRSGRRRWLLSHVVTPVGSALAAVAIAAGLFVAVPHGSTPAQTRKNPAIAVTTPATFGWLPAGFTTLGFRDISTKLPASAPSAGTVFAEADTPNYDRTVMLIAVAAKQAAVTAGTVPAADVNGKPARWVGPGRFAYLQWEYAPGRWVRLIAGGAASKTWIGTGAQMLQRTKTDLFNIATHVKWGRSEFKFPYEFTHALPASWTLEPAMSGRYEGGSLVSTGTSLQAGLLDHDMPDTVLEITVVPFAEKTSACTGADPQYIEADGVQWRYLTHNDGLSGDSGRLVPTQVVCALSPVDGQSVTLTFVQDKASGTSGHAPGLTPNPGVAQIGPGGVKTILSWLKFLGPNPANWTTHPFAS